MYRHSEPVCPENAGFGLVAGPVPGDQPQGKAASSPHKPADLHMIPQFES